MIRDKNGNGNNGRAANPPDFRGSFPILKPILRIYEFVTKHPIFITVVCKKNCYVYVTKTCFATTAQK